MAKKEYNLKDKPASAPKTPVEGTAALVALSKGIPVSNFVSGASTAIDISGFQDLSLPPIIPVKDLKPGNIIFGEVVGYSPLHLEDKKIHQALVTLEILRGDEKTGKLVRINQRGAMPIGAVLARALGTSAEPAKSPETQIAEIRANGWTEGTVLAMKYVGQGKERSDRRQNAPHLWEIKAQKPTGETLTTARK